MSLRWWQLVLAAALLGSAERVGAHPYEVFIDVQREEDLYDLYEQGEIGEETLESLVELYQRGVDLASASRDELYALPNLTYADVDAIVAYREAAGGLEDPAALVIAGVIDREKLEAMASFLMVRASGGQTRLPDGWVRTQTRWAVDDERVPPFALQGRVYALEHLRAGAATTLTRDRLGEVVYDPGRDALSAQPAETRVHLPKGYVAWNGERYAGIAGTYRIGFGQRLTFDTTGQVSPNGFFGDDEITRSSEPEDFRWRDGLLGVAAGARKLPLGPGTVQAYGFFSVQPRSVYQYELYDRSHCSDPRAMECEAPAVFRTLDDPFEPAPRLSFETLPDMVRELVYGGNVTYSPGSRTRLGLTGYGAQVSFLARGIDLDFQESSPFPFGGPWGAVGLDGAYGIGNTDLFAEMTRSFDSELDGGGGFAALLRSVTSFGRHSELESSLRYYDEKFANPFARPIAQPDELEGNRARDEAGARLRYLGGITEDLQVRALGDLWVQPSRGQVKALVALRGDYDLGSAWRAGLSGAYQDKDLGAGGRDECFETAAEEDEMGEPVPCSGSKLQVGGRLRYQPSQRWFAVAQYQHAWVDENGTMSHPEFDRSFRQDLSTSLLVTVKPFAPLRLRLRSRHLMQDIEHNDFLEHSLWSYLDLSYRLRQRDQVRLRYDVLFYLDERESTLNRSPVPEQWLWLSYDAHF